VGALPDVLFHVARDQATSDAWERAAANYDEGARLARETGQGGELAMALAGLACLDSRAGRSEECREHAADAVVLCRERSMHFGVIWCELALGDLALSEGESSEAAARLTALAATLDELGVGDPDLHPGPELVDALLRTGQDGQARQVAERFAADADATGRAWTRGRADRALGLVAPDDELDERFASALARHGQTRDVFERARTELAYGMRLRRAGRRVDARVPLRDALRTFDALGARIWGATTRTELGATGERVAPREGVGPDALTPQELQVCLLLAEGRTTREAAAALFLSPKTVEYHLRKVYTRLGIHSREELAAVLRATG
jgi:DNA-binding CsgD family transcriptional regulator